MRRLVAVTCALAALLLVAGCDDDQAASVSADAPSPAAGAQPSASAPATTLTPTTATTATTAAAAPPPVEPTATTGATFRDALPLIEFERSDGTLVPLPTEMPPRSEYGVGLSGRYSLDERGMLFRYTDPESRISFWMKNTHVDLAIAFIGADFRIVEIRAMEAESLDVVKPEAAHQFAVEAPAGWYAEHGIKVGDRAYFRFELPAD